MRKYLVLTSLVFTVLFAFTNNVNAVNTIIKFDNKEAFPIQVDLSESKSKKTTITVSAKTTKTIVADHESTLKISAEQGSKVKLDLRTIQEDHPLLVTLDKQALEILDKNLVCMNIKPFRPLE